MSNCPCGRIARVSGLCYACYNKKRRQINPEATKEQSKRDYTLYREKHALDRTLRAFFTRMGESRVVTDNIAVGGGTKRYWRKEYICSKCHKTKLGHRIFINNLPHCRACANQIYDRQKADEILKYSQAQDTIDTIDPIGKMRKECTKLGTCDILHFHHELLKDDPERLKTDFLIGLICGDEKVKKYKTKKDAYVSDSVQSTSPQ